MWTYYILDKSRNFAVATRCDLEEVGREPGVLAEYERMARE